MSSIDRIKLDTIRRVIIDLGDPEFWSHDQLDVTINTIDEILEPQESFVFWHRGGSITDDGQNETEWVGISGTRLASGEDHGRLVSKR